MKFVYKGNSRGKAVDIQRAEDAFNKQMAKFGHNFYVPDTIVINESPNLTSQIQEYHSTLRMIRQDINDIVKFLNKAPKNVNPKAVRDEILEMFSEATSLPMLTSTMAIFHDWSHYRVRNRKDEIPFAITILNY